MGVTEFGVPLELFFPAPASTLSLMEYDLGRVTVDQDAPDIRMGYIEITAYRTLGISLERFAGRPESLEGIPKSSHAHNGGPPAFRASCSASIAT